MVARQCGEILHLCSALSWCCVLHCTALYCIKVSSVLQMPMLVAYIAHDHVYSRTASIARSQSRGAVGTDHWMVIKTVNHII